MNEEDITQWGLEKLRRKRDQEWELAGCARRDGDEQDEAAHTSKARMYSAEIGKRVRA